MESITYCVRLYLNALQSAIEKTQCGKGEAAIRLALYDEAILNREALRGFACGGSLGNIGARSRPHISNIYIPQCKCNDVPRQMRA